MENNIRLANKYTRIDKETIVKNGVESGASYSPQTPVDAYAMHRVIVDIAIVSDGGNFSKGAYIGDNLHGDASIGSGIIEEFFNWLELRQGDYSGESLDPEVFTDSGFKYKLLGTSEEQVVGVIEPIPTRQLSVNENGVA